MAATIGELQYVKSVLVNTHVFGLVTDGDTPDGFSATFEITGDNGVLVVPALQGDQGIPGQNAFALRLQLSTIDDPLNLPETLGNTDADIGKYWMIDDVDGNGNVIGSSAYIWFGDHYRRMMMGSPGPAGPVPIMTWNVHSIQSTDANQNNRVMQSGDAYHPNLDLFLNLPKGDPGPASRLALCPDISMGTLAVGDFLGWDGALDTNGNYLFKFLSLESITPKPLTIPESAFTSYQGLSQRATIGSYQCPPRPFPWKPWVTGHMAVAGLELSPDPLTIGAEVRLGDPVTGALVGRGFGTSTGQVIFIPHTSTPSTPSTSLTPENDYAKVPANHTNPALGTLYVNLYNDGVVGVYIFNPNNAQLGLLQVPV